MDIGEIPQGVLKNDSWVSPEGLRRAEGSGRSGELSEYDSVVNELEDYLIGWLGRVVENEGKVNSALGMEFYDSFSERFELVEKMLASLNRPPIHLKPFAEGVMRNIKDREVREDFERTWQGYIGERAVRQALKFAGVVEGVDLRYQPNKEELRRKLGIDPKVLDGLGVDVVSLITRAQYTEEGIEVVEVEFLGIQVKNKKTLDEKHKIYYLGCEEGRKAMAGRMVDRNRKMPLDVAESEVVTRNRRLAVPLSGVREVEFSDEQGVVRKLRITGYRQMHIEVRKNEISEKRGTLLDARSLVVDLAENINSWPATVL